jgi:hypothetical protein
LVSYFPQADRAVSHARLISEAIPVTTGAVGSSHLESDAPIRRSAAILPEIFRNSS